MADSVRRRSGRRLASERGQAAVELVALLPAVVLLLAVAWQFALVGEALWQARVAARAAARAGAVGADAEAAAKAHLPAALELSAKVGGDGAGDATVAVEVPTILRAFALGRVSASAHFEPQGS
jgi:hypothetical protein